MIGFDRSYPRYHGHVIRPHNEQDSLVIQVMYGCAHGKCIYCGSYMGKAFRLRPLEFILEDIEGVEADIKQNVTRVFLSDGDVLALPLARLVEVLDSLREQFPRLQRVSAYATPHSLLPLSVAELGEMREHGLEALHVGLESGDDVTLALTGRGLSAAQQVAALLKAKRAGMALSLTAMLGLGGIERSAQHARSTGQALSAVDPGQIEVLNLMPEPGTRLAEALRGGQFTLPDARGLLQELRDLVSATNVSQVAFRTNHTPEYLNVVGSLPGDKTKILRAVDDVLSRGALPPLRPQDLRTL